MKKITVAISGLALLLAGSALTSCGGSNSKDNADTLKNVRKAAQAHDASTNIAFVNLQALYAQYTLAKELQEENTKLETDLNRWATQQQQSLQSSMNTLQQKVQAGQMTEQSAQSEYEKIMQRSQSIDAEGQRRLQATDNLKAANVKRLQDSIHNYLVDFNVVNKFDAILPTDSLGTNILLYNPALDITDEVIAGLNSRYKAPAATTTETKK